MIGIIDIILNIFWVSSMISYFIYDWAFFNLDIFEINRIMAEHRDKKKK
jgi:hypothetical protein